MQRVNDLQLTFFRCCADNRKRAAFAFTERLEQWQTFRSNRQHITLLRFITPDFFRCQTGFFQRDFTQIENRAAFCVIGDFRECIRQTTCTNVMDRQNRIVVTQLPAGVNHFLRTAFHFRITTLHGIKIQICCVSAGCHRRRSTATHTNTHTRTAQLNQQGTDR